MVIPPWRGPQGTESSRPVPASTDMTTLLTEATRWEPLERALTGEQQSVQTATKEVKEEDMLTPAPAR